MRPKSIATVVVTFLSMSVVSSTPCDSDVIAASVLSGGISDTAFTKVVFPTPKPPATTSFTEVTLRVRELCALGALAGCVAGPAPTEESKGADTFDHPREGREFDLDGVAATGFETVLVDEVTDDHDRHPERNAELGGDLGDRDRFVTQVHDSCRFETEVVEGSVDCLHHRLHLE